MVRNNTENKGQLFTAVKDITGFDNIETLIKEYNGRLYYKHKSRELKLEKGHIYIQQYKDDTQFIVGKLNELAKSGVSNYANSVKAWLQSTVHIVDCNEKKKALARMFERSKVSLIYGSAGTGKSTLINHISHFFLDRNKLYLANTNPAVDNLKRRVTASNCDFYTVAKFTKNRSVETDYDILIIDECSTVSNRKLNPFSLEIGSVLPGVLYPRPQL